MKIGKLRIERWAIVYNETAKEKIKEALLERYVADTRNGYAVWDLASTVLPEGKAAQQALLTQLNVEEKHPVLLAVRTVLGEIWEDMRRGAPTDTMANHHGDLAHVAGGRWWLEAFAEKLQRSWVTARAEHHKLAAVLEKAKAEEETPPAKGGY